MRIDLPGFGHVELRDRLTGGDRSAYMAAITFKLTDGELRELSGDIQERQRKALLRRLITGWDVTDPDSGQVFPNPALQHHDDPRPALDEIPLDVYDVLVAAIEPHMYRLTSGPVQHTVQRGPVIRGELTAGSNDQQK